jgi:ABC-type multidrug transport system ATPase subunit
LILDEATANIDTVTEVYIQQALEHLLQGRTAIVIAHRLSTVRNADWIYVLDHGSIVEQGSHGDLIDRGGLYSQLYARQFSFFQLTSMLRLRGSPVCPLASRPGHTDAMIARKNRISHQPVPG